MPSKIYDVEKMYGQDFSIVTTNAPSNIIKQAKKLLPNILLISSPKDGEEDVDNNLPAIFVTDYNAQPLQLTYAFCMKNGLNYSDENGYAFINIDNSTITTENIDGTGKLKVETNNLKSASFNNKGVVKLSTEAIDIDRNLSEEFQLQDSISNKYKNSTFITVNNEGILYINNDFLSLINNLVDLKIKQKLDSIKIMLNNNLKMWIVVKYINGIDISLDGKSYNLGSYDSINIDDLGAINDIGTVTLTFDLYYLSFNNESETVNIVDESNKIYDILFSDDGNQTYVSPIQDNDELYQHMVPNITLIFLPNYFIENNESYNQDYQLLFKVDDKEQSLSFRQNKLSNFNDKFYITISPNKLIVNDMINTSLKSSLVEKIINNDVLQNIIYNNHNIINFKLSTFIIHPNAQFKNIDNYEKYLLIDNYEYKADNDESDIFLNNIDDNNNTTLLYNFINSIISQNSFDEDKDNYEIDYNESVPISDTESIRISDYIKREILDNEISYSIGIGIKLEIYSDKNINLGIYSVIIPIELDMGKSTKYGYIYIKQSNGNGNNNNTPYIYYEERSSSNRIMVSNTSQDYTGFNINPSKLYCIFNNDLILTDNEESNKTKLNINYQEFKQFDTGKTDNQEQDSTINDNIISFDDNSLISLDNKKIVINLINDNSENGIYEMAQNIYTLLTTGNYFTIYFNKNNTGINIIRSQQVQMNINLLYLMLSNIKVSYDISNPIWKTLGDNINNSNPENSNYYQLNNYVITNDINNNNIKSIKIGIPNYIIVSLNNGIKFNILLGCYYNQTIEYVKIEISRSNNKINASISQNLTGDILSFEGDHNNFDINYSSTDEHYIQLSVENNDALPKLLIISFNFGENDSYKKTSYIEDTSISISGGGLDANGLVNHKISLLSNNGLNDIIYVTDSIDSESEYNKDDLKRTLDVNNSNYINVQNLDNYTFSQNNLSDSNYSNFNLVFYDSNDTYQNYSELKPGEIQSMIYKYKYLSNPNHLLDDYNRYCLNTAINGNTKFTSTGYRLRFTEIYIDKNDNTITNKTIILNNNTNVENEIKNKLTFKINNSNITPSILIKDDNAVDVQPSNMSNNTLYNIYITNISCYDNNSITINNLYTGYQVKITN